MNAAMYDLHDDEHTNYTTAQLLESARDGCEVCADWYDETPQTVTTFTVCAGCHAAFGASQPYPCRMCGHTP